MLPTFQTARLSIRPLEMGDCDVLYKLIYAQQEVRQYFTTLADYDEVSARHREKVAQNVAPANRGFGFWGVVRRDDGQLLGQILLNAPEPMPWVTLEGDSPTLPLGDEVELGYAFGQAWWGQGYAAESCRAVIEYAFDTLQLPRLVNSVLRGNSRSIALMARLGFAIEPNLAPDFDGVVGVLTREAYQRGRE